MLGSGTHDDLIQCVIECLDQWFTQGYVLPDIHPVRFRDAIWAQGQIGWRHFFMGKLAKEWTHAYDNLKVRSELRVPSQVWCTRMIEYTLRSVLELWETRNNDVHGGTDVTPSPVRKDRLSQEVRRLQKLRNDTRPVDSFLFLSDVEAYIEKSTANTLASYISTTKRAILKSVKRWEKQKKMGVVSITRWLRRVPENEKNIKKLEQRICETWRDGRKKVRKHDSKGRLTCRQQEIVDYLSLYSPDN